MISRHPAKTGAGQRNAPAIPPMRSLSRVEEGIRSVQRCQLRRVLPRRDSDQQSADWLERKLACCNRIETPLLNPTNRRSTCLLHCVTSMRFETTLENPGPSRVPSQIVHGTIVQI